MKQILPVLFTILLLSGCLGEYVVPEVKIVENLKISKNKLGGITFNVPEEIGVDRVYISVTPYLPDGTEKGNFSKSFGNTTGCFLPLPDILLYYAGIWKISYGMSLSRENDTFLEGNYYLYVPPINKSRAEFVLEEFIVPPSANYGDVVSVSFTVGNVGNLPGTVPIVVYNDNLSYDGEKWSYGKELFRTEDTGKYLEDDYEYSKSISFPVVDDMKITIRYAGKTEVREIDCHG